MPQRSILAMAGRRQHHEGVVVALLHRLGGSPERDDVVGSLRHGANNPGPTDPLKPPRQIFLEPMISAT